MFLKIQININMKQKFVNNLSTDRILKNIKFKIKIILQNLKPIVSVVYGLKLSCCVSISSFGFRCAQLIRLLLVEPLSLPLLLLFLDSVKFFQDKYFKQKYLIRRDLLTPTCLSLLRVVYVVSGARVMYVPGFYHIFSRLIH